jgi:hypothetical protein
MIQELDRVVLTTDLPEHNLKAGDVGTVVLVHGQSEGYEVEFVTLNGETVAVVSAFAAQVRPIDRRERRFLRCGRDRFANLPLQTTYVNFLA